MALALIELSQSSAPLSSITMQMCGEGYTALVLIQTATNQEDVPHRGTLCPKDTLTNTQTHTVCTHTHKQTSAHTHTWMSSEMFLFVTDDHST